MNPTSERSNYWQHHITQYQASGLSGVAYCTQAQITYHCFLYWRSKLAKGLTTSIPNQASPTRNLPASTAFVTVRPSSSPVASEQDSLQLALPNGLIIHNIHPNNVSTVRALLEQL